MKGVKGGECCEVPRSVRLRLAINEEVVEKFSCTWVSTQTELTSKQCTTRNNRQLLWIKHTSRHSARSYSFLFQWKYGAKNEYTTWPCSVSGCMRRNPFLPTRRLETPDRWLWCVWHQWVCFPAVFDIQHLFTLLLVTVVLCEEI